MKAVSHYFRGILDTQHSVVAVALDTNKVSIISLVCLCQVEEILNLLDEFFFPPPYHLFTRTSRTFKESPVNLDPSI